MQNCIGAIDGTHIPMTIPPGQQEPYRNRKQSLSQNMMVACDFDLKFVHVHAGWEGSTSDARALQDAVGLICRHTCRQQLRSKSKICYALIGGKISTQQVDPPRVLCCL